MPNFNTNMFQRNAKKNVARSFKDLSHEWKHDFSLGYLIPCLSIPTLPSDSFEITSQFFFKFDPLYYPMIHRVMLDVDYWWVRNTNMWSRNNSGDEGWEEFIMMQEETLHPVVDVQMLDEWQSEVTNRSIYGYCGVPYLNETGLDRETKITGLNAFLAMAYLQIYDQGYRHPQLEAERSPASGLIPGDNTAALITAFDYYTVGLTEFRGGVFPAKWGKDYFTSLLPEPQVGDAVQIPLVANGLYGPTDWLNNVTGAEAAQGDLVVGATGGQTETSVPQFVALDIQETAATIRDFSLANMLQVLKEQLMRFGQRYTDWIDGSHDVNLDPTGLGVPKLLGSVRGFVNVTDALTQANTTVGESDYFTGDYTGNAGLFEQGNTIRFDCPDYGLLLAIFSLVPNTGYGQGIPRWLRYSDPLDYPMDIFQTVGDQEVLKEEVMYTNKISDLAKNQETFGYGVRYQEAMTIPNNYGTNLAYRAGLSMHLGKWYDPEEVEGTDYDNIITLNREFLEAGDYKPGGTRVSDVFKVLTLADGRTTDSVVVGYIYHKIGAMRPLASFSTPSLGV